MELRLLIIFLFFGLFACKSDIFEDSSKIGQLKKALIASPTKENRDLLITAYQDAVKAKPNDLSNSALFSEMAKLHVDNKASVMGLQTLMQGISDYPTADGVADNVWMLSSIYEQNIQSPSVAAIIKKLYLQVFPNGTHAPTAKQTLASSPNSIPDDISALGSSMYDETTHKVDFQAANDYIRVCELFALLQPENTQSPEYLHKAGETARAVRSFPKAVAIYDWIYTQYPNYEKAAQALFLKAFTYDNDLNDKATAKTLYEEFLKKFPEDDFADDTQFLLSNLGKDDEEIIKGFNEN